MMLVSIFCFGVVFSIISSFFVFWSLVIEKTITLEREAINLNPADFIRSTKITMMTIVKNIIDNKKENIEVTTVIETLLNSILFGLLVLFIPLGNESPFNIYPSVMEHYSIIVKAILAITLLNSFNFKNNLIETDLYYDFKKDLNKLIIVLFNLYVIGKLSPSSTGLISKYPGVFISLVLVNLMYVSKNFKLGKSFLVIKSKYVFGELTWLVFILSYFFNVTNLVQDKLILISLGLLIICCLTWLKRILSPIMASAQNLLIEDRVMKFSLNLSLINFIGIEIYAIF